MLVRDLKNARVAGVCAGLGNHFGTDPLFFRLAFVVGVLCYGIGCLPYLILWLLTPEE